MNKYLIVLCLFLLSTHLGAQKIAGEILIKFNNNKEKKAINGFYFEELISKSLNMELWKYDPLKITDEQALAFWRSQPDVEMVQFNHHLEYRGNFIPDDSLFSKQWNVEIVGAPAVWKLLPLNGLTADNHEIVMAMIDDGANTAHADLKNILWENKHEIPNNAIDDDNNGFIDDFHGWNFRLQNDIHSVDGSHGTAVAGIMAAEINNHTGIAGIGGNAKLMLLSEPSITDAGLMKTYNYVLEMRKLFNQTNGAQGALVVVTNASLGLNFGRAADFPLWCSVYDALGAEGVLNVASTTNLPINVDISGDMPSECASDFLITVTNTDKNDIKVTDSGYGLKTVDIGAPGEGAFSLDKNDEYYPFGQTSAAAPHVTGAIALLYASPNKLFMEKVKQNPATTALWLKELILTTAQPLSSLDGKTVSGGRLSIDKAFERLNRLIDKPDKWEVFLYPNPSKGNITIEWAATEAGKYEYAILDITGKAHISGIWEVDKNAWYKSVLPTEKLATGVYFFRIRNEKNHIMTKLLTVFE